jgi:hypothetical protein
MRLVLALGVLLLPDGLAVEEFERLHRELKPAGDETWRAIPWKTSILDAREQAIAERKPVFLWSMDGHPLGCG